MSEPNINNTCYGHMATSEVGCEHRSVEINREQIDSVQQSSSCGTDVETCMRLLTSMTGHQTNNATTLKKFDPEDPDADIERWCSINEVILKHKGIQGTNLLLLLTQALRGRAASCLSQLKADFVTWKNVKELLIAKFSKPMLIQDYFNRIVKFQISNKETAAEAAMRLWQLIEAIPKTELIDEVITGFVISILSQADNNLRRELSSLSISSKAQLCRVLRGITLKRRHEDLESQFDNKRMRYNDFRNNVFRGTCHRCGETGHKIINCPRNRRESTQLPNLQTRHEERRSITCYGCGHEGHLANACPLAAQKSSTRKPINTEVRLCGKEAVSGELQIGGMAYTFFFDTGSVFPKGGLA